MKTAKAYRRLPGRHRTTGGQSSLWLGADHVLAVERVYFEERYRRFHFSDIQALVIRPTRHWHVSTLLLLLPTLVLAAGGWWLWRQDEPGGALFVLLLAFAFLLGLVVHLVKGRSCRCCLQMNVGIHDLAAVRRLRQARKLLDQIRPLVMAVQKDLPVAMPGAAVVPSRSAPQPAAAALPATAPLHPYAGRWHLLLFAVLTVDLAVSTWYLLDSGRGLYVSHLLLSVAVLLLAIAGLVAQQNTRLPDGARIATWFVLGSCVATTVIGYFYTIFAILIQDPKLLADQTRQFAAIASLQPLEHLFLAALIIAYIGIGLGSVAFGLRGVLRLRRDLAPGAGA